MKEAKMPGKLNLFFASVIFTMLFISCAQEVNNSNNNPILTKEQVTERTAGIIEGTIIKSEIETEHGIQVWEIYVIALSGGELKIKFRVDEGTIVEIKGIFPSFDYEINPGMNLINYSFAKSIALNAKNGELLEWKLEKDESDETWQYRFQIRSEGRNWEVRISAETGMVIRIS